MNQTYGLRGASEITQALESIPKAELWNIQAVKKSELDSDALSYKETKDILAVVVADKIVSTVSPRYKLIQHKDAFRPVIDGVTIAGVQNFNFSLLHNHRWARLNMYVTDVDDGAEGIKLGFRAENSVDGKSALRYGFKTEKYTRENVLVKDRIVTVWGMRQVCTNGMTIRVPLEWQDVVRKEIREKVSELLSASQRIEHIGNAEQKVQAMQFVTEAFVHMREPVRKIIDLSKKFEVADQEHAIKLIKKYVGKRMQDRILKQFDNEDDSLWGLYNAVTFVASHGGLKVSTSESLIAKSALMLEKELRAE